MLHDTSGQKTYQNERIVHWDNLACQMDRWYSIGGYYHQRIAEIYRALMFANPRVLEIGCGQGDLLAALEPSYGVGVDFSREMILRAHRRHPHLNFIVGDAHDLPLDDRFDYILFSDLLNDVWDVQTVFEQARRLCSPHTRLIINTYSRMWEIPLKVTQKLNLSKANLNQNWLTIEDIANLLHLADFEVIRHWQEILWPLRTPIVDKFFNRLLVKLWPLNNLALTNIIIARPKPEPQSLRVLPRVSVVIPARNEAGNIPALITRTPEMGSQTELVFVEGHSKDNTYQAIEQGIKDHPYRQCKLLSQTGTGKGDAVRIGFQHSSGDILMILDADMTVPPEDLRRFYQALIAGKGELINGVRLVYPMEKQAMRFINFLGNKFFSLAFSFTLGQPIKDTLCGTKVLWKSDYEKIDANRSFFGDFDPFGDFDLLFGAAKRNMKIIDLPIRYRERTYGTTNIQRWRHGWLLLKMLAVAAARIKFV